MRHLRISIIGFGTVGRWLAGAIHRRRAWLEIECGVAFSLVSVATRRHGSIYREGGFDISTLLDYATTGRKLSDYPGVVRWDPPGASLTSISTDVLVEASNTNPREPEPALSHIRQALDVNFQEVVHSIPAVNADVAKQTVIRGGPNGHSQECASDAQRSRGYGAKRC